MSIEALLQETNTNVLKLIALIQSGASAANDEPKSPAPSATEGNPTALTPVKRGRGRPVRGEETPAVVTQTPTPAAAQPAEPDPFSIEEQPVKEAVPAVSLAEVRAALFVVQAEKNQAAALDILKNAAGVETITKLTPDKYAAVFNAAIPSGKLALVNVRAVLVAAQARISGSGQKALLEKGGTKELGALPEEKFVAVIIAAHEAK